LKHPYPSQAPTTDLRTQLQSAVGTTYTLERELGGGGMSRVFLATETALGRKVVIKVLPPETAAGVNVERFRREIQLAASLQHPHIVPLHAAASSGDLLYFTMPFIEGESLRARIARDGELPVHAAVRILRDVADALAYAHQRGVVHRDIKPDNVLLSGQHALVTDFGVAKALESSTGESSLTSLGVALGTPAYMSPEQAAAESHVDHRADIYAFGCLAYEMLTGRPPFAGMTAQQVLAAHVTQRAEPVISRRAACPPALAALVTRCLEKKPADRPQQAAELHEQLELAATPSGGMPPTTAVPATPARPKAQPGASRNYVIGGVATLVLVAAAAFAIRGREHVATNAAVENADSLLARSVAVLPFANLSGDKDAEYFSDGMTDELISALGKVQGLRVPARTSVFAFKDKALDLKDVGAKLNVGSVLEGSVRRAGDRLRVTAQLVSVRDGFQMWSESYDRQLKDVFAVQDDIARAIVTALEGKLAQPGAAPLVRASTGDLAAFDLYLQGRFLFAKRGGDNLREAIRLYRAAIAKDPKFARAYAGLAEAYAILPDWTDALPVPAYDTAATAARRALALDSTLAEAHAALGYRARGMNRAQEAEREFRHALALNPSSANIHKWYANYLEGVGDLAGEQAQLDTARQLDPLSLIIWVNQGDAYLAQRRYDAGLKECQAVLAADSANLLAHNCAARAYLLLHRTADVVRESRWLLAHGLERSPLALLIVAYAQAGDREAALAAMQQVRALPQIATLGYGPQNAGFAALGERDSAFAYLEREEREIGLWPGGLLDPLFDPIRTDPRFSRLERQSRENVLHDRPAAGGP
jgi:serine/threonine-protein kinase